MAIRVSIKQGPAIRMTNLPDFSTVPVQALEPDRVDVKVPDLGAKSRSGRAG
jgi:hypothetical protein